MPHDGLRVAVVGATGAVGREALDILAARGLPPERVAAFASPRSSGELVEFGPGVIAARPLDAQRLREAHVVLLCTDAELSRALAPKLVREGILVIDNSSAFRAVPDVPLIIPEVNGHLLQAQPAPRLVANPNCSTTLLLVALEPLRQSFGISRVIVSTYQAVSGAGQQAIEELRSQTRSVLDGQPVGPVAFPEPCAFNVFSHESPVEVTTGLNAEEQKMIVETRRIWNEPQARIVPTCVRVPVLRAHSQSVTVELRTPPTENEVREALRCGRGLSMLDDRSAGLFPTPLRASGRDAVLVGRVRRSPDETPDACGRVRTFCLWLSGDQLRKGAALNAIQIMEVLLQIGAMGGDGRAAGTESTRR